jgi:DNA-binding response OmpR family regulator
MNPAKILVVDDEPGMVRLVALYLQQAGFDVLSARTGTDAIEAVERRRPDLVVLDVGLPDVDGLAVFRRIREIEETPVIMLTARGEPRDRIAALEGGVDDYVPKPFHPEELVARVRAVLRRARPRSEPVERLEAGGLSVDVARRQVILDGELRELRPKEFDLLVEMMRQPGRVFTRDYLLERIWGYEYMGDGATVDVHVWRLRSKLGETRKNARFIHTVWGVGYSFDVSDDGA